jgi:hypothetical protein
MRMWQIWLGALAILVAAGGIGLAVATSSSTNRAPLAPPRPAVHQHTMQVSRIGLGDFTTP